METYLTNFSTAANWCNNSLILCNDIVNIDSSIYDNMMMPESDMEDENYNLEIYQYFLTDCNECDVDFLRGSFPELIFSYSDMLGLYVLCVDHCGTSWDYVRTTTTLKQAARELGEK